MTGTSTSWQRAVAAVQQHAAHADAARALDVVGQAVAHHHRLARVHARLA